MTRPTHARVWLITGAGSGFGRAIAQVAPEANDTVIGAPRRPEALDELAGPKRIRALRRSVRESLASGDGRPPATR